MDVWFPDWLIPQTAKFGLDDFTAVDSSAVTGAPQSSTLFGTRRWHCRMDFPALRGDDGTLQLFQALVGALRGRSGRAWIADPSYFQRGSFPTLELVGAGRFPSSSGWSTSGSALTVLDYLARVQNSGAAAGYIVNSTAFPITSGAAYVIRAGLYPGSVSAWAVNLGTTSGGSTLSASGALTTPGLYLAAVSPVASSVFLSLLCNTAVAGNFVHYTLASLARGALVNGASQTGNALNVKALPVSTSGLLRVGDVVQIPLPTYVNQLVRLTAPLASDSSGNGYMQFEPELKESPAANAAVAIQNPMGRYMLANGSVGVELTPGVFGNASLEFIEA